MRTIIQMELLELVKACQQFQNDNLPKGCRLHINLNDDTATVWVFHCADHAIGLQVKRLIGLEDAEKSVYDPDKPYHTLNGSLGENVYVHIECSGLPPMCRIEEYEEEIPAQQVIQTGEKTVVRRTRICCGEAK